MTNNENFQRVFNQALEAASVAGRRVKCSQVERQIPYYTRYTLDGLSASWFLAAPSILALPEPRRTSAIIRYLKQEIQGRRNSEFSSVREDSNRFQSLLAALLTECRRARAYRRATN